MQSRYEQTAEDLCFEHKMLATYGPYCKDFCYAGLIDTTGPNWDRTSRQAAIRNLVEGQPLYFQPEPRNQDDILMVNAHGRGMGCLEAPLAKQIAADLRDGLRWHAHVRQVHYAEETQSWSVIVMLLLMATPEQQAQRMLERKTQRDFSMEWTLIAVLFLGVALTML